MAEDYISRQAAISAICNACGKIDCDKMDKCEKLQLPPANCSEFPNNSDTISRQAAIDALDKRFGSIPMEQTTEILLLRKDLRELPSAQPERKKGEWVLQSDDYHEYYECDQCGIAVGLDDVRNFCPNCGAKMKGAKHETDTNVCNSSEMPNSSDYIRRQDAVDAVEYANGNLTWAERDDCKKRLEELSPADVVKVVRCDDCKYYGSRRWCELHSSVFDDNAFCSYGERREE